MDTQSPLNSVSKQNFLPPPPCGQTPGRYCTLLLSWPPHSGPSTSGLQPQHSQIRSRAPAHHGSQADSQPATGTLTDAPEWGSLTPIVPLIHLLVPPYYLQDEV